MELNVTFEWTINIEKNVTTETDVRILAMSYITYKIGEYTLMTVTMMMIKITMNVSTIQFV